MKIKSEVFLHFCVFQKLADNIFNTKINTFVSDGDDKFYNISMLSHFSNLGIFFRKSIQTFLNKMRLLNGNIATLLK